MTASALVASNVTLSSQPGGQLERETYEMRNCFGSRWVSHHTNGEGEISEVRSPEGQAADLSKRPDNTSGFDKSQRLIT